jgi:HlyD family secretion protein
MASADQVFTVINFPPSLFDRLLPWRAARAGVPAVVRHVDYLADPHLEDILTEQPSRLLGGGHYLFVAMFVSLLVVASVVKVDTIVVASGRLMADTPPVVVQPMELSVIREIRVKAGDFVKQGDVLATLDPTFTQADTVALAAQRNQHLAEINRLEAELAFVAYTASDNADDLLQRNLYHQRQLQFAARLTGFDEDLHRYQNDIKATQQNLASIRHQLDVAREVEGMRAELYAKQVGSKLNYLDAQATRMHAERDSQDMATHLDELRHSLESNEASRQVFMDQWHRDELEDLSKARAAFSEANEALLKAQRRGSFVELTAPTNGVVLEIAKKSIGSVLNAAEPLVTIVPSDAPLIADVMIASADVGYTKTGDEAALKVDAYPYVEHGFLKGRLRSIGEESFASGGPDTGVSGQRVSSAFHRAQIELTTSTLDSLPPGAHLFPGLSMSAEIKVGTRTVIAYFLNPILRGLHESIREP